MPENPLYQHMSRKAGEKQRMNSKERMTAVMNHQIPDRVPLDIGGINNTGMHQLVEQEVKRYLNLKDNGYEIKALSQLVVIPDQSVVDYFGVDTCSIYINEARPWIDNGDGTFKDMWGVDYRLNPDGYYFNMVRHPLEAAEEPADLDTYSIPEPNDYMIAGLSERLDANSDKYCILEGLREPMFGLPSWLRRNDNFYVDLLINKPLSDALHEKLLEYYKKLIDFVMQHLGDRIDIVKLADDMGAQNALLLSPETYRARIKPYQKALYGYIKDKYNKKILLHSCGSIQPIIGDLIEIGVDALNPVQISADNMDPVDLKNEFGKDLVFWGGGIDTQHILSTGTPAEVKADVKKNMSVFKQGGGYVFAQVHNIQPGVPVENVIAMYDAYNENRSY